MGYADPAIARCDFVSPVAPLGLVARQVGLVLSFGGAAASQAAAPQLPLIQKEPFLSCFSSSTASVWSRNWSLA